jgi:hypothetical protein
LRRFLPFPCLNRQAGLNGKVLNAYLKLRKRPAADRAVFKIEVKHPP